MRLFPLRIELANAVAVQRAHDAGPGEHHRPAVVANQQLCLGSRLPFRALLHRVRQAGDVVTGVGGVLSTRPSGSSKDRLQPRSAVPIPPASQSG
jgi:hypothetical protein